MMKACLVKEMGKGVRFMVGAFVLLPLLLLFSLVPAVIYYIIVSSGVCVISIIGVISTFVISIAWLQIIAFPVITCYFSN
jgi:hypothetical protein